MENAKFHKSLAKYYIRWFHDCHDSANYCLQRGMYVAEREYLDRARVYLTIIMENWEAIEFFGEGDRAFMIDSALPEQYRGYK